MDRYPKRLIEVDLPIKRISAHARREKSIRRGHISTLHIWWARRPLAACRAVVCAALWPDPVDALCPPSFLEAAFPIMRDFAKHAMTDRVVRDQLLSEYTLGRVMAISQSEADFVPRNADSRSILQQLLLDFIADFANWDASANPLFLDTARALTQSAHEALGGAPGTRPLVVDPFAGGGSIPLEALRVGADAFASDLNPVAVLLSKVAVEYIPRYGQQLADEVRKWGESIKQEVERDLGEFYPKDSDDATPIAYLWARTIRCEGPGCGAEVPLIRSLWLAKKGKRSIALQLVPNVPAKRVDFKIIVRHGTKWVDQANLNSKIEAVNLDGTVKRGSATCPCCGYTTPVARVRAQLKPRRGGTDDARLMCVVTTHTDGQGRSYRIAAERDLSICRRATSELEYRKAAHVGRLSLVPDEKLDVRGIRHTWAMVYGLERWGDYFTPRQALSIASLIEHVKRVPPGSDTSLGVAVRVCLALAVGKQADRGCSLCRWIPQNENIGYTFGRQAIGMMWDFVEAPCLSSGGGWNGIVEDATEMMRLQSVINAVGHAEQTSATAHLLPGDSAQAAITDPPYYDSVPYAHLSDFFYVWLRRALCEVIPNLFVHPDVPKDAEIVVDRPHELSKSTHDIAFYERELTKAFAEGRRIVQPDGIGAIVFASKSTASWEAFLRAVVDAGWVVTASWPIDTEREARIAAQGQARLGSSIHLVCRPRENRDGSVSTDDVGDWRDLLSELPKRVHEWMPHLAEEGVVGADAIFACLGPALEIFSRYSRVEKASGEVVTLKEYLEQVWAAVAKEALTMIFTGADATGFEEDARITAMWLWTLRTSLLNGDATEPEEAEDESEEEEKPKPPGGYSMEYDAARKIAQGLGVHMESMPHLVQIRADTATLLPVAARTRYLFGKESPQAASPRRKGERQLTLNLFEELEEVEEASGLLSGELAGRPKATVLDQLHQAMILFGAGRSEALRRFLVTEGVGRNALFWRLAQSLSALYPSTSEEKRWLDGVLARKKGLGL